MTSRGIASNLLDFEMALKTEHGFNLALLFNQRHRHVIFLYYNTSEWQIISFLKRAAIKSARIVDDVIITENVFFHVTTGTRSVFVF